MTETETKPRRMFFRRPRLPRRPRWPYRVSFSVSLVLGRTVGIFIRAPHLFLLAAAPAYLLILAPKLLDVRTVPWSFYLLAFIGFHLLIGFFAGPVGAMCRGRRPGPLAFLLEGSAALLNVRFLAPALAVATLLGFLLVLPGLLVFLLCCAAIPAAAREGLPARAALQRSAKALSGALPEVFASLLLLLAAGFISYAVFSGRLAEAHWFLPFVLAAILPTVIQEELA